MASLATVTNANLEVKHANLLMNMGEASKSKSFRVSEKSATPRVISIPLCQKSLKNDIYKSYTTLYGRENFV